MGYKTCSFTLTIDSHRNCQRPIQKMLYKLRKHHHLKLRKQRGFSLIEVLVAATVFTIGLAGFSALLVSNIVAAAQAREKGIAAISASSLSEQIQQNPVALKQYLDPPKYVSKICAVNVTCSPEQLADYNFRLWQLELADRIRNARGLVCRDETPEDGVEGNAHCDGTGPLVIKIFWQNRGSENGKGTKQFRYSLQIS